MSKPEVSREKKDTVLIMWSWQGASALQRALSQEWLMAQRDRRQDLETAIQTWVYWKDFYTVGPGAADGTERPLPRSISASLYDVAISLATLGSPFPPCMTGVPRRSRPAIWTLFITKEVLWVGHPLSS